MKRFLCNDDDGEEDGRENKNEAKEGNEKYFVPSKPFWVQGREDCLDLREDEEAPDKERREVKAEREQKL